jgi:hypothetical protein
MAKDDTGKNDTAGDSGTTDSESEVLIVRRSETSFFIHISGRKQFFNLDEMRQITRVCHAAEDEVDGARRLHRWLKKERDDVLKDTGIESPRDARLQELHGIVVSTYTTRK